MKTSRGSSPRQSRRSSQICVASLVALVVALAVGGGSQRAFVFARLRRAMGQGITTTQFYLYGRSHFTQTGWENHAAEYPSPDPLDAADLQGRVWVVTGANSGLGLEIVTFLAKKGAKVYMVCRSLERAASVREELEKMPGMNGRQLVLVQGDMGLQKDVRRVAAEIAGQEEKLGIDGLVCNAGALLNERTLTAEGVEVTFATHFLFGSYLLTKLLLPSLQSAAASGREPRVIHMSSGGMYNVAFPEWHVASSMPSGDGEPQPAYDGQLAYAYAKRGQVLLCERWAADEQSKSGGKGVTFVSAHPGWTSTKGVMDAYGDYAKWLDPMRTTWQGAEGICWLCTAPAADIEGGAFYLDRRPQVKHIAGPFFTEGSFTRNTDEEVDAMLAEADRATRAGD
eukprot:TRINITY_DN10439_c0_g1_i2.p1 TRINITY_DN10439_c0_g1~~TRINITY_DN10439_c0_g1_i2.p1  ORF type:complete len:397 (-),score=59.55 TRINITY_DN10439_c0_g1_i2:3-1193(-)